MKLVTKTKVYFGALLLVGALGFYFLNPGAKGRERDHTNMTLTVTFTPNLIATPVKVNVRFNGTTAFSEDIYESPWSDVVTVEPGMLVSLATAHTDELDLKCQIVSKEVIYGPHRARKQHVLYTCVAMATG